MSLPREANLYVQLIETIATAHSLHHCQQVEEANRVEAEAEDLRRHLLDMAEMMEQAAQARKDDSRGPMAKRAAELRLLLAPEMIRFQCEVYALGAQYAFQESAITVH